VTRPKPDFLLILKTLVEHEVDFIIVGGVCAVLHGAPIATFDLDLVHSRAPDNIVRLMAALEKLEAYYRDRGIQGIRPGVSHLSSPCHQLLMTKAGPLDLLGAIGSGRDYAGLLGYTEELQLGSDLKVRLLKLETLIETKEEAGRDKDKAVLALLRRTLQEKSSK